VRDTVYSDAKVSRPGWHRHHQSFGLGLGQGLGLKGLVSYSVTASILCPRQKCSFLGEIRTPHLMHGSLGPVSQMRRDCGFIVSRPLDLNQLSSSWTSSDMCHVPAAQPPLGQPALVLIDILSPVPGPCRSTSSHPSGHHQPCARSLLVNQLSSSWSPDAGGTGTPQHWTSALAVDDQLPPVDVS